MTARRFVLLREEGGDHWEMIASGDTLLSMVDYREEYFATGGHGNLWLFEHLPVIPAYAAVRREWEEKAKGARNG